MGLACAYSVALVGLDGRIVEVEADIGSGLPRTVLVGLPDTSLYEARDRCKAATSNSGESWPQALLTINLSPATLPKAGSHYDLAIVAAVLAANDVFQRGRLAKTVLLGELGLDGRVRPVRGILPATLAAAQAGFTQAIVPLRQAGEAQLVEGIEVLGVASLDQLVALFNDRPIPIVEPIELTGQSLTAGSMQKDLADVVGQLEAKWALEVAAAGRHHLYLHGPPGVGKTMLAERLPGLLPDLEVHEALEVSAVHSLAGFDLSDGLVVRPPYADPHHSASMASIVGGGPRMAKPGAISCAHRGVLFLDEAPEFSSRVLDSLRTPLESGVITLGRSEVQARYPAQFQLVLAANPCPCGQAATPGGRCHCPPMAVRRYADKISGPIRDRIDMQQAFVPMKKAFLRVAASQPAEPSTVVASRVAEARARQAYRLAGSGWRTNGEVSGPYLRTQLPLPDGLQIVEDAVGRGRLSPRGVDKVLRVAWTLADLGGRDRPGRDDVAVALAMRRGEPAEVLSRSGA
ncbi:MAG: MG(2+) CHELATASE FAMILY PROTEIN / ComM-related protein [uncultured Propionibacteriaceae bacterium]|uniref:MG(2+) CHELATASE FAMILY PROTEIN / ComM-related protein n=1 Tax=uncultured Propionibacteriaceae bacterium TaxID=257457 RepID=A0A6J4PDZ6_9ACTN|nr:MAG: MG(2+) CHELATASE FAMILY PROTEIN / ComM-related protein [uncultured Propionibacteriaceae bacterium]